MIYGRILGGGAIPILTSSEVADWEASLPLADGLVFNSDTGQFHTADGDTGSIAYKPLPQVLKDDSNPNTGTASFTWLFDKNILLFVYNQTILRVVSGTPAAANEVQYDYVTGVFTLHTGTFSGKWVSILYDENLSV